MVEGLLRRAEEEGRSNEDEWWSPWDSEGLLRPYTERVKEESLTVYTVRSGKASICFVFCAHPCFSVFFSKAPCHLRERTRRRASEERCGDTHCDADACARGRRKERKTERRRLEPKRKKMKGRRRRKKRRRPREECGKKKRVWRTKEKKKKSSSQDGTTFPVHRTFLGTGGSF